MSQSLNTTSVRLTHKQIHKQTRSAARRSVQMRAGEAKTAQGWGHGSRTGKPSVLTAVFENVLPTAELPGKANLCPHLFHRRVEIQVYFPPHRSHRRAVPMELRQALQQPCGSSDKDGSIMRSTGTERLALHTFSL